jgi:hypothetical protein
LLWYLTHEIHYVAVSCVWLAALDDMPYAFSWKATSSEGYTAVQGNWT